MSSPSINQKDTGIYYFLGNITSHILHALPLYEKLGGTFVVTSNKARKDVERIHNVPVINIDNRPYKIMKPGRRPKLIHEYIVMDDKLKKTYDFLNTHAKVVVFYELFNIQHPEWLKNPKKLFIPHGNMLKSYMTMHPQRLKNIMNFDYMAALSPYMKRKFISDGVPAGKLIDVGIARTDKLLQDVSNRSDVREQLIKQLHLDPISKIVLYSPTFWGDSSIYHTGLQLLENISDDYTLLFRPHPQTPRKLLKKYRRIIKERPNIRQVTHSTPHVSLSDLLVSADAIVVDRSSIALEALLTGTPLVFAYDTPSVEPTEDYDSIVDVVNFSQNITRNSEDVNLVLSTAIVNGIDKELWQKTCHNVWFQPKGGATKIITQHIKHLI